MSQHNQRRGRQEPQGIQSVGDLIDISHLSEAMRARDRAERFVQVGSDMLFSRSPEHPKGQPWRPLITMRELVYLLSHEESRRIITNFRNQWLGLHRRKPAADPNAQPVVRPQAPAPIPNASYADLCSLPIPMMQLLRDVCIREKSKGKALVELFGAYWPVEKSLEECCKLLRVRLYFPRKPVATVMPNPGLEPQVSILPS